MNYYWNLFFQLVTNRQIWIGELGCVAFSFFRAKKCLWNWQLYRENIFISIVRKNSLYSKLFSQYTLILFIIILYQKYPVWTNLWRKIHERKKTRIHSWNRKNTKLKMKYLISIVYKLLLNFPAFKAWPIRM